jgi:glycosyltransferase involved in cell wall biosynthesis
MKPQSIGNLHKVITHIKSQEYNDALLECFELLKVRPFHPEAILQIVDLYFRIGDDNRAASYIKMLYYLTPNWNISINLYKEYFSSNRSFKPDTTLISICMIVKNEEKNLNRCLQSIKQCKNYEIIIVDTGSTDDTIKIAKNHNAKIYEYRWGNDFSAARNKAMEYARGDWILILDADEELAPNSYENLKLDMAGRNIIGYRLPLENVGSPLNGVNYVPRFFRNAPGLYFIGKIHETIYASLIVVGEQWNMDQGMGYTKILHHGYQPDQIKIKGKIKRNLEIYEDALAELPDEPSILMNYAHDLNHDGQTEKAYEIFKKIHRILEQHKTEDITPEVREQFVHNYGVFLAQEHKMEDLVEMMFSRTARDTGPVANVHYMAGLGLINCKRFEESIREFELCIEKAYDNSLAPSVPDIRTWKPRHLLANANASLGNEKEAIRFWEEVLVECDDSPDPFHDYARYLSSLNRNKEALEILIKSLDSGLNGQKIWELGAGIVNSDPELAGMAMDWTEEAVQYFPKSDVTNVRRGEALMKNGRYLEAIPFFERLTSRGERNATAAQLICKKMLDQLSNEDLEKVSLVQNELKGWTEIMDKAPGDFDRELAEQLIQ